MVTTAALRLEIDARQMKQGAAEAEKAIVSVGEGAKKTAREVKISTESIEKKLDAIVEGMILHNNKLGESNMQLRKIAEGVEKSMVKAEASTQSFGREVGKTSGIVDTVEKKFAALGKAAVGMFAVDVVAKVAGFTSAMDLLNKASGAAADAIKRIFTPPENESARMIATIRSLREEVEALRAAEGSGVSVLSGRDDAQGVITRAFSSAPFQGNVALMSRFEREIRSAQERITAAENQRLTAGSYSEGFARSMSIDGSSARSYVDRAALQPENVLTIISQFEESFKSMVREAQEAKSVADYWANATKGSTAKVPYRADLTEFYSGNVDVSRRSRSAAEQFAINWQRNASLNTSEFARLNGFGGIADAPWNFGLESAGGGAYPGPSDTIPDSQNYRNWDFGLGRSGGGGFQGSLDTDPRFRTGQEAWLRGRDREDPNDTGYIGRLNNRYTPEAIAEQFSSNLYQSMEYSLLSGDFSNFGRSVVSMIGQSLMENLVAAPFQEAMAVLMQSLLTGIRGVGGGGTAPVIGNGSGSSYTSGNGYGAGAPLPIQAGSGPSNSVAPYRSSKQRYDDLDRRRLR